MKKRLMANMQDEEQDENKIESIDSGLQNKNPDKLDLELSSPTPQANLQSPYLSVSDPSFTPSVQTKPSLVVPLSVLNESDYQPTLPTRQPNYDLNRPFSPSDKLDQMLNEQLSRNLASPTPDLNNNYMPSFYDQQPFASKQYYGQTKPKKVNIAQELADERNFNCVPSASPYSDFNQNNYGQTNFNQTNYNQTPKLWSSNQPTVSSSHPIQIEIQKDKPQNYSNPSLDYPPKAGYSPVSNYERSQSQQSGYQIPIANHNKPSGAPVPPQRQQSLNRSNLSQEREIPVAYEEPIQSKSFKILQKLTADIEEEIEKLKLSEQQHNRAAYQRDPLEDKLPAYYGTLNHIEEPRIRSERRIPIQVENSRRDNYSSAGAYNPEYHSKNEQTWIYQNNHHSSLPSSANSSSLSDGSFWTQPEWVPRVPASKQAQLSTPLRYQGGNIPSRTFRLLQMLANEDDW